MKNRIFTTLFGIEFKMIMSNNAINTCPSFDYQESDEDFALRNLKFFLESLKDDTFDDFKPGQRIVLDSSLLVAEIVFLQEDYEILVTKFIEENQTEKYINKYGVQTLRATCDELKSA